MTVTFSVSDSILSLCEPSADVFCGWSDLLWLRVWSGWVID